MGYWLLLRAGGFEPTADIDLSVTLAAIMARAGRVGILFRPLIDGKVRAAAINDEPANRVLAFLAADFTSIDRVDHS